MKGFRNEKGHVLFQVASIWLPLLLFIFSVGIDTASYYTETRVSQRVLDEAASFGARYLPFLEAAETATRGYLKSYREVEPYTSIKATENGIELSYKKTQAFTISSYFGATSPEISSYSRVSLTPGDTLLFLDTSFYMAPDLESGSPFSPDFPEASLFQEDYTPAFENSSGASEKLNSKLLTEQCFNPYFSSFKRGVITLYNYLSSFGLNKVGVKSFPGSFDYSETLKELSFSKANMSEGVNFPKYRGKFLGSSTCMAASTFEVRSAEFRLPVRNASLPALNPLKGAPLYPVKRDGFEWNKDYSPYLSASEAIWSEARKAGRVADFRELLLDIETSLISSNGVEKRKNLESLTEKKAFVFLGDVAWVGGVRFPGASTGSLIEESIKSFKETATRYNQKISIYFLTFKHPGNQEGFKKRLSLFKELLESKNSKHFSLSVIEAKSPEDLTGSLLPVLALTKKDSILLR